MDKTATLRLWKQCQEEKRRLLAEGCEMQKARDGAREIWNAWARARQEERDRLKANGLWKVDDLKPHRPRGLNDETTDWLRRAEVDFEAVAFLRAEGDINRAQSGLVPKPLPGTQSDQERNDAREVTSEGEGIDFSEFIFPGKTNFSLAIFHGWAWMNRVQFDGPAIFTGARFEGWVGFEGAQFRQTSRLNEIFFGDFGAFRGATFHKDVFFDISDFVRLGDFRGVTFKGKASFFAIASPRGFFLDNATFAEVPDFVQADFAQAPTLDPEKLLRNDSGQPIRGDCYCYGALKRIAAQGQDHRAEIDFFVKELEASPATLRARWKKHAGSCYGLLSDHGRSIWRPLLASLATGVLFAFLYWGVGEWTGTPQGGVCKLDFAWAAAALIGTVPLPGFPSAAKRDAVLTCIEGGSLVASNLLVLQTIIAGLLFFLFLLALRNHFRIR